MQFGVFGEVTVVGDPDAVISIPAPKQRALLALLILNANRVVSPDVLVDGLWGETLPEFPTAALQVVVSRLRSCLGPWGERVVAVSGGYRLDAAPDETDVAFAEALLRDGRAALGRGDATGAAAAFERALSLWRGEALEGLTRFPFAATARRRLAELRLSLVEARNDAMLVEGRHLEVLADVDTFVASEPWREHLRAQQVVALLPRRPPGRSAQSLRCVAEGVARRAGSRALAGHEGARGPRPRPGPEPARDRRRIRDPDSGVDRRGVALRRP